MDTGLFAKARLDEGGKLVTGPSQPTHEEPEPGGPEEVLSQVDRLKKPPTAYFLFMMAHRKDHPGVSTKDIGAVWASLGADERQLYVRQATQLKEDYSAKLQTLGMQTEPDAADKGIDDVEEVDETSQAGALFPIGRLKTLVKADSELSSVVRGEALKYLQHAMTQFVSGLSANAIQEMRKQKKKKLTAAHIYSAADQEAKYSWLLDANLWPEDVPSAAKEIKETPRMSNPSKEHIVTRAKMDEESKPKPPTKMPTAQPATIPQPKPTTISSFFQKK